VGLTFPRPDVRSAHWRTFTCALRPFRQPERTILALLREWMGIIARLRSPLRRYAELFGVLVDGGSDGGERLASDTHLRCGVGAHVERGELGCDFDG
jgi:hypothetical protein